MAHSALNGTCLGNNTTTGHLEGSEESVDLLHGTDGTTAFSAPRISTRNDHGTGCTLSSAIAALLPRYPVIEAVRQAKAYLQAALAASDQLDVGRGHGPLHHFHALWTSGERADGGDLRP